LKLLASECRRAEWHLAGKRQDLLQTVVKDQRNAMSEYREKVKSDLENGVFKGPPKKAIKDAASYNPEVGFMRQHATSEFTSPSRAAMEEYEFKHPGSYPALTHYRPNHEFILKK
jgi:hypothetical protein